MKKIVALTAFMVIAYSSSAYAQGCSALMTEIDMVLATETHADPHVIEKIQNHRADGERLHKAGQHDKAENELSEAMELVGGHETKDHAS